MVKVLITGANSYIGDSVATHLKKWSDRYIIEVVDMKEKSWKEKDFSSFDVVFHVAGIAHSDNGVISKEKEKLYYSVNCDLAVETALKAKEEGVRQFIFMSSAIVYGESALIGNKKIITADTPVSPANCYGDSKVQAENRLGALNDALFKVVLLRAPMIYGKGSKGNYPILSKLAKRFPLFPYVANQRSMLYVENLAEFVRLIIDNEEQGVFWPQNQEYGNTSEIVRMIAMAHGKRIIIVKGFTWLLKMIGKKVSLVNKAFGNLTYDFNLSTYKDNYCIVSLEESIRRTEVDSLSRKGH